MQSPRGGVVHWVDILIVFVLGLVAGVALTRCAFALAGPGRRAIRPVGLDILLS